MNDTFKQEFESHRAEIYAVIRRLTDLGRPLLLRSDVQEALQGYLQEHPDSELANSSVVEDLATAQEAVIHGPTVLFALRPRVASWRFYHCHAEGVLCREVGVEEYLVARERVVDGHEVPENMPLEVDFGVFERGFPRLTEARSIGRGVEFLNRQLAGRLFANRRGEGPDLLFDFLRVHQVRGQAIMLNAIVESRTQLIEALRLAADVLENHDDEQHWDDVAGELRPLGFEAGWGRTVGRIRESMSLLTDIFEAASPETLESFLRRIPMIFSVAIFSPHGWFGQTGVLGRPDTGGQIVYILDQVRALEKEMRRSIREQGLDIQPEVIVVTRLIPEADGTTCDQRSEAILGTENARILRVPFRDENGEVHPRWISRFSVWPYLERYANECENVLLAELGGRPDLIVGNYSDGNLVASLLARRLEVTQCNIAHALEKTKYLHSDLYWRDHEDEHHFATQYTADLIAMNSADFIITSTYQEIAGTKDSVGQYESYDHFSLPGLYRVRHGIDAFDPKFNIVSPGADADVYFPHWDTDRRLMDLDAELKDMVFGEPREDMYGRIDDVDKPLLLTVSRFDRIKNIASLVRWYAECPRLRERSNLLIVGGFIDAARSSDAEEREQIEQIHAAFEEFDLAGQVRWVGIQADKTLVGELYRFVADRRGAFVQPALFEAFGLTVIEAMVSGLPVFATCYGGPLEIIEEGKSGFHIDPNHGEAAAEKIATFFEHCATTPSRWDEIGRGGYDRVQARYTWKLYAERLLDLSRIYGFWKFVTSLDRQQTRRYLDMFYALMYRPLARKIGDPTSSEARP